MAHQKPRILTRPLPGYYLVRMVRKGWPVAARIDLSNGRYAVECDGIAADGSWTEDEIESIAAESLMEGRLWDHPLLRVSCFGEPCDEATYRHRLAMKEWALVHNPRHPAANPMKPIDPRLLPAEDF